MMYVDSLVGGSSITPVVDSLGRSYATGRRKCASSRVWVKPGAGVFTVNGVSIQDYLKSPSLVYIVHSVFRCISCEGKYDVYCTVKGGGLSGQAGAIRHGLARAVEKMFPHLRAELKAAGFLTRDSRIVERKKYGQHKARKKHQFSKR